MSLHSVSATKTCTKCRIEKHQSEFYKDKAKKDGLFSRCKKCHIETTEAWRAKNKQRVNEIARKSRWKNIEAVRERNRVAQNNRYAEDAEFREAAKIRAKAQRESNKEAMAAYFAEYRAKNADKIAARNKARYAKKAAQIKARVGEYQKANKEKLRPVRAAISMKRFAAQRKAVPAWANLDRVAEWYVRANEITASTGVKHHVDHIVPIQGKLVCGLHVENNLQILPGKENQSKGNRWWPDGPEEE